MRSPLSKVRQQSLLSVNFRPELQNLLLAQEFEGEGRSNGVGQSFFGKPFEAFWQRGVEKRVASFVKFDQLVLLCGIRCEIIFLKIIHLAIQEGFLRIEFKYSKRLATDSDNLQP